MRLAAPASPKSVPTEPGRRVSNHVHTVPSVGSVAIAAGLRGTPRIGNSGEPAQPQPALQALAKLSRAVKLDAAGRDSALYCEVAHPHARHGLQVGRNVKINLESRIGGTKVDLPAIADQPPGAFRRLQIGKSELHADPARREGIGLDAAPHVPHQHCDVEFVMPEFGAEPTLAPFPQLTDDRRKFPPRLGEVVLRSMRALLALDNTDLLELFQSQAEQAA